MNKLALTTFIKQLDEFLEDVVRMYPTVAKTDDRFLKCKMYFDALKMSNPKLMITTWKSFVNTRYRAQIDSGDVNFFMSTADYRSEVPEGYNNLVESAINDLRDTVREMDEANVDKSMKYIRNLCKLADMYT
jgi:hypothetical protein